MNNINNYITSIIQVAYNNLPIEEGWETFTLKTYAVRKMIEISAYYTTNESKQISFNQKNVGAVDRNNDLTFLYMNLRKAMYELTPNKGAWFTSEININKNGKFTTHFDYDNIPEFAYTPSDEKFIDDYKSFPRDNSSLPSWLKEILDKNNTLQN